MSVQEKLQQLGLQLPPAPKPAGVYKPVLTTGGLTYFSGHGPLQNDGTLMVGKVGQELDQQQGYQAAKQTGLTILATFQREFGDLDRIARVVKLFGMVNCTSDFAAHPAVINGCSELFRDLFGDDQGVGVRSAVGMGSLPGNMAVEIEGVFELKA